MLKTFRNTRKPDASLRCVVKTGLDAWRGMAHSVSKYDFQWQMFGHNNSQQGFYIKVLQNIWFTVIRLYSLTGRRGSQVRLMLVVSEANQLLNVLYVVLDLNGFPKISFFALSTENWYQILLTNSTRPQTQTIKQNSLFPTTTARPYQNLHFINFFGAIKLQPLQWAEVCVSQVTRFVNFCRFTKTPCQHVALL